MCNSTEKGEHPQTLAYCAIMGGLPKEADAVFILR
jgi:hypothetical protein